MCEIRKGAGPVTPIQGGKAGRERLNRFVGRIGVGKEVRE